jgi:hypothetical protein
MQYTEYRSKCLKELWPKVRDKYLCDERNIINQPKFSCWTIDNVCAVNWKNENPISVCVSVLMDFIDEIMRESGG